MLCSLETNSLIDCLFYLFSMYFVFDLKYPECFKQILSLFHVYLFPNFKNIESTRTVDLMSLNSTIADNFHDD